MSGIPSFKCTDEVIALCMWGTEGWGRSGRTADEHQGYQISKNVAAAAESGGDDVVC